MKGPIESYQQLANEYDDMICKRSYWDRVWDENWPTDEEWEQYQVRSGLTLRELHADFEEWFDDISSYDKRRANEVCETWKKQFNYWFD